MGHNMSSASWRISEKEHEYLKTVLESGFPGSANVSFTTRLEQLFAERFDSKYAISFANGTATLHAALAAVGVGPGDEVIVPPLTMASTSLAVLYTGAMPVYADIEPDTFEISPAAVRNCLSPRTKAIIPVALYGLAPDLVAIRAIADEHGLKVIEDDAQCFLGTCQGRVVGSLGDIASFSFQNSKHITCGEGGIVVTSDEEYALFMRRFSSLGYGNVSAAPGRSKIDKREIIRPNFARHICCGYNYRLSELCAAVAVAQLEKLDDFVAWRRRCAEAYAAVLNGVDWLSPQAVPPGYTHSYWAYTVKLTAPEVSWDDFQRKFVECGGDGFYGAWRLTYTEPYFREIIPAAHHRCPVAEAVQPRLMQFKTNYGAADEIARQAEALARTIDWFDRFSGTGNKDILFATEYR